MKRYNKTSLMTLAVAATLAFTPNAFANQYGTDITVFDGEALPTRAENNEAEYQMVQSQGWDLEGFFLKGNVLTMIGGFNFFSARPNNTPFTSGDIFFNTKNGFGGGGTATPQGNNVVNNTFGYEYALDIDWTAKVFSVIDLAPTGAKTQTVYYSQNTDTVPGSNPWKYSDGGTLKLTSATGDMKNLGIVTDSGFADWTTGLPDTHYAVSFDLTKFFSVAGLNGKDFDIHFTMGCGNDNLMGHGTAPVPEPATMLLLGTGLAGLAGTSRRRKK